MVLCGTKNGSSMAVVFKPVLQAPLPCIFCMSPLSDTPNSTHQLVSRNCKTWIGCVWQGRHPKCAGQGCLQYRFENHCSMALLWRTFYASLFFVSQTLQPKRGHWMQNSLSKLFEHKCELEVCVHIHLIMIKTHSVFFFIPILKSLFLKSGCSTSPVRIMWFCTSPSHNSWLTRPSYVRPALSELSAVCLWCREDKMPPIKRLRCFVVVCNNEHSSRH